MNRSDLVSVRDAVADDVPFLLSTILKGLLYGGDPYFRKIPQQLYYRNYHLVVERLLSAPGAVCRVACLKDSPDVILSYCAYRPTLGGSVITWTFTKKDWRGIGLAKSLWPEDAVAVTHLTRAAESILKDYPKIIFNPFL